MTQYLRHALCALGEECRGSVRVTLDAVDWTALMLEVEPERAEVARLLGRIDLGRVDVVLHGHHLRRPAWVWWNELRYRPDGAKIATEVARRAGARILPRLHGEKHRTLTYFIETTEVEGSESFHVENARHACRLALVYAWAVTTHGNAEAERDRERAAQAHDLDDLMKEATRG